jgi:SAM-dependent methyltransferase
MKRNLLYYLYPKKWSIWPWHIEQLLKHQSAFNGRKIIVIAVDNHTVHQNKILPILAPLSAELLWVHNDPGLGETRHFLEKLALLESKDPNEATFYAHAKGVTQSGAWLAGAVSWSKAMYELNLGNVAAVEKALSTYSSLGCFRHLINHAGAPWCYAGTFFWFKHSALFSRTWRKIEQSRFGVEGYIGQHFRWGQMGTFTPDNVGPVWLYNGGVTDAYIQHCKSYWEGRHMHGSVMNYLRAKVSRAEVEGKDVLEIGSYNVNGTPRDVFIPFAPKQYLGIDQGAGPGVDRVIDASNLVQELGSDKFDVVLSTEMLEHAQDWRKAVSNMKAVTKPGGLLYVTTRGPGFPFHGFPHDYWRYTVADFRRIFMDMEILDLMPDPECPGVFIKCRKPLDFKAIDLSNINLVPAPAPPPPTSPPAATPQPAPPSSAGPIASPGRGSYIVAPPRSSYSPSVTPIKH